MYLQSFFIRHFSEQIIAEILIDKSQLDQVIVVFHFFIQHERESCKCHLTLQLRQLMRRHKQSAHLHAWLESTAKLWESLIRNELWYEVDLTVWTVQLN